MAKALELVIICLLLVHEYSGDFWKRNRYDSVSKYMAAKQKVQKSDDINLDTEESSGMDADKMWKLRSVGFWLRQHKYYEIDQRYVHKMKDKPSPYFWYRFPKPHLAKMEETVAARCRLGVTNCINEIYNKFKNTPYSRREDWVYKNKIREQFIFASQKTYRQLQFQPFVNTLEQFQYRATASYFMCYFTLQRMDILKRFGEPCELGTAKINRDFASGGDLLVSPQNLTDYRAKDLEDFDCSFLSFCPDICCGHVGKNVMSKEECKRYPGNPCGLIADGGCIMEAERNMNIQNLIRNNINYTCDCPSEKQGYVWNVHYERCVDEDECSRAADCKDSEKTCVNTIGSYMCICRWGFKKDPSALQEETASCVKDDSLTPVKPVDNEESILVENMFDALDDNPLKIKRRNLPFSVKAVYYLNYYTAVLLNYTMHTVKFEDWVEGSASAPRTKLNPLVVFISTYVTVVI